MNEQELEKYIDDNIQEHLHDGKGSRKTYFNDLREVPGLIYNPLTADLSLNGYKITGGTLISGQTEVTSLEATDEFLISDASDSGNLKRIDRQYFGEYSYDGSSTTILSSNSGLTSFSFTVLFSGVVTIGHTVTRPTTGNVEIDGKYILPGQKIPASSTDGTYLYDIYGTEYNYTTGVIGGGTSSSESNYYVYAGTRVSIFCGNGTMQVTVKASKTLRTAPYAS